jgi:hypothetical protein
VSAILLIACGDEGLSEGDIATVLDANAVLEDGGNGEKQGAVDDLIRVCRKDPDAKLDGESMSQIVEDASSTLRASDQSSAAAQLADELDQAAANGCS